MKLRRLLAVLALATVAGSAWADGLIVIRHPPFVPHPGPWPRPHPVFAPLEVVYHNVDVAIDGQKATTHVDQEFFNRNDATLEGEYLFPIPKGAHIDKFTMRVGDRDLEAELLDAGKARSIYEEIVRQQRDPALLEYTGRGAFRVRIFPIEPHSRKRVQLTYTELLTSDAGTVSYLYPLNTEKFSAEPLQKAAITVKLNAGSPLKALYSPSHTVEVRRDGDRRATVSWETTQARPDRDFQLLYSTADTEVGVNLLAHREADEGTFLLLAAPGADVLKRGEKPNPKDVVFVVDTSGSMAGKKLVQAKKALAFCVENLNDDDRFELVRFSTESEPCFEKLTAASRNSRDRAASWIDGLKPMGGTAIYDALQQALKLRPASSARPFVVIFLTDGQPTVGETNEDRIAASVASDSGAPTRIFCFGIGTDVNTHLLDKIVERTRAASQFVLPDEDLELKVSAFFTKIREPLLTDLKISWPDGVRVTQAYPHPLPDLFRGDQLVLAGRYTGTGEGDVVIEGLVNGHPHKIVQHVRFPARADNEFIPQLWAVRRVGWLLDEIRLRGDHAELRDEVVQLARRYAIVTPYTSYLIVEDEARRNVPLAQRSFSALDSNLQARDALREGFADMGKAKVGDVAARNARANASLKSASNADEAVRLSAFEVRSSLASGATGGGSISAVSVAPMAPSLSSSGAITFGVTAAAKTDDLSSASRVVGGKTFFQNGTQWIDAATQHRKPAKTVRLQFGSDEYFRLLTQTPDVAAWLALGRNVQFTLGDTLYDVAE
jgi:Ca-activated chloride channel family protein